MNLFLLGDRGFSEEDEKQYDDTKIDKLHVSKFSCGELKVCTRSFDVCTARYERVSYCWRVSKTS